MNAPSALLIVALVTGCVEIKNGSPDSTAARVKIDTGSGALAVSTGHVDSTPASTLPKPPPAIGDDSVTRIHGNPLATRQALSADTTSTLAVVDSAPAMRPSTGELGVLQKELIVPVSGVTRAQLRDSYDELRGGTRRHEAIDILAARGTPVLAAAPGRVLKLFNSKAGGLMVYQADSTERFILMYAHLDAYQPGLADGQPVRRGQQLGIVGTTGDAPANLPHLHFAIASSSDVKQWWKGAPMNPYPVLTDR